MAVIKHQQIPNKKGKIMIDHEAIIRDKLITLLKQNFGEDSLFVPEVSLLRGKNIIDLLAVYGHSFHGFEIKSGADTLKRLPKQAETYGKVFDYITLVIHTKHYEKAKEMVPAWWGIILVDDNYELEAIRIATDNPKSNLRHLCKILWREDLLKLMREKKIKGRTGTKSVLVTKILKEVSKDEVRALIKNRLYDIDKTKCPRCDNRFVRVLAKCGTKQLAERQARTSELLEDLEIDKIKFLSISQDLPTEVVNANLGNLDAKIGDLELELNQLKEPLLEKHIYKCKKCYHEYSVEKDIVNEICSTL